MTAVEAAEGQFGGLKKDVPLRPTRIFKSEFEEEKYMRSIVKADPDTLKIEHINPVVEYGVRTTKDIDDGVTILAYLGRIISWKEANILLKDPETSQDRHSYLYYYQDNSKRLCVDSSAPDGRLCRILNHSKKDPNLIGYPRVVQGVKCILFRTTRPIKAGEELRYDHKEKDPEILALHPWLRE